MVENLSFRTKTKGDFFMEKTKERELTWLIEEFMIYCKCKDLRRKTMKSYEQALRLFERWSKDNFNICSIDEISENIIRRYINDLQERGKYTYCADDESMASNVPSRRRDFRQPISSITINNYLRNIRVFFKWLVDEDVLRNNPMRKIKALKQQRIPKEYMSDKDFHKLVNGLDKSYFSEHRDYALIILMLDTGMRLGECTLLMTDEVDLPRKRIYLKAEKTKGRKDRVVYFSEKTELILRRWLKFKDRYMDSEFLFPSRTTKSNLTVTSFETNFKRYLERCGIQQKLSPHCLRNNFAKRCLMNGMDIYTLSRLLGHSSVTITEQAYLDLNEEDIAERYKICSPINNMQK